MVATDARDDPAGWSPVVPSGLEVLLEGSLDVPEVAAVSDGLLFVGNFEALDDDFSVAEASQAMFSCESLLVRVVIFDMAPKGPKEQKRVGSKLGFKLRNSASQS